MKLTPSQRDAIEAADTHAVNAELPSYSGLLRALTDLLEVGRGSSGRLILSVADEAKLRQSLGAFANAPTGKIDFGRVAGAVMQTSSRGMQGASRNS